MKINLVISMSLGSEKGCFDFTPKDKIFPDWVYVTLHIFRVNL